MSMNGELRQIPAGLMGRLAERGVVEQIMEAAGLSVGKAWNGLHFLYCGDGMGGESAISGGVPLDHVDTGYGPPQYLTPEEVARYADELEARTDDQLRAAYDPEMMEADDVYGGNWDDPAELEWLLEEARKVRAYYRDAAVNGAGMLQFLS